MKKKGLLQNLKEKFITQNTPETTHPKITEDNPDIRKIRMNVKGVVQGVGFRYMTKRVADNLGVTGAVWNEDDGSVSIEALGTNETIELFIKMVKSSPSPSGMVNEASVEETPDLVFSSSFKVTYK
jgi:acylphosphatase